MIDNKSINSFILIFFVYMGALTLPIKQFMDSGLIVWILTPALVLISIFINRNSINIVFVFCAISLNLLFLLNILIVPYKDAMNYLYLEFLKFSLLGLFFSTQQLDFKKLYKYWYIIGYINIFIWTVYLNEVVESSLSYMFFGVTMTMSFSIIFYNYLIEKRKIDLIVCLSSLLLIFLFGNRSAVLACLGLIIVLLILKFRKPLYIFYFSLTGVLLYLLDIKKHIINLIVNLNDVLLSYGIKSYPLWQFKRLVEGGLAKASSGRDDLYEQSLDIIKDGFLPRGVGYYQYLTSINYPHNFFLDFFIIFGFIGIILLTLMIWALFRFYKYEKNDLKKDIVTILLVINFIRLFFSSSFIFDADFWILIGLVLTSVWSQKKSMKLQPKHGLNDIKKIEME